MQLAGPNGAAVPMHFIANDGNLLVKPVPLTLMPVQGTAERFEVIVDFSKFKVGDKLHFVNVLQHNDGLKPAGTVALAQALKGVASDPAVGPALELRVVSSLASVDGPVVNTIANSCGSNDKSYDPASPLAAALTEQIPVVTPVRTRVVEFTRGPGDSRQANGECIPDCPEAMPFPWVIKINGQAAHSMNANRVGLQIPKAGEIEHWTYVNGGGGWDHPIHLHFEEGITMNRGNKPIDATELLVRKDVWRLGEAGQVTFQVQFGEYGGSYVNHCHNTVHEDFALLMRIQLMTGTDSYRQVITATPNPTPDGVFFTTPDIIPEGNPYAPHGTAKPKA
jgi:FtsP/CotA-like multicopper oxidase with cupredoxin domain